jgi:hypothetical protein
MDSLHTPGGGPWDAFSQLGQLSDELGDRPRHRGMLPAVDALQHRRAAMALSEKAPKLVALAA